MNLAVTVAPFSGGFQARTGSPLDLSADGPTADAAVESLRNLVAARVHSGEVRVIHVTDPVAVLAAAAELGRNPQFEEWVEAVQEYRRIHNTIPDNE